MNKTVFGTILIYFILLSGVQAQKSGAVEGKSNHKVYVDFQNGIDIFYPFEINRGNSVYRLSKAFQVEENKIYKYNGLKPGATVQPGDIIKVPIIRKKVVFTPPQHKKYVILLYKVKPRETLYHIAKRKMNMDLKKLQKLNGLAGDEIREGGELILGWYVLDNADEIPVNIVEKKGKPVEPVKKEIAVESKPQAITEKKELTEKTEAKEEGIKISKKRVIGFWDKTNEAKKGLFVLSNLAKTGTKIELYYTMNQTKVIATVMGRIPAATYPDEIELYVSPEVARRLGIFDSRFSVETRFIATELP